MYTLGALIEVGVFSIRYGTCVLLYTARLLRAHTHTHTHTKFVYSYLHRTHHHTQQLYTIRKHANKQYNPDQIALLCPHFRLSLRCPPTILSPIRTYHLPMHFFSPFFHVRRRCATSTIWVLGKYVFTALQSYLQKLKLCACTEPKVHLFMVSSRKRSRSSTLHFVFLDCND